MVSALSASPKTGRWDENSETTEISRPMISEISEITVTANSDHQIEKIVS